MAVRVTPAADTKTVTTAGTPVALTDDDVPCNSVAIRARTANTGVIYIVDVDTNAKKYPADGLVAGEDITIPVNNASKIRIDSSVNAEGVSWLAV